MNSTFHNHFTLQDLETTVNTRVIFSAVQKQDTHILEGQVITFSDTEANVGNGMNPETGVFNVPVPGIYAFSFSAQSYNAFYYTDIYVYKNGEYQFRISDANQNDDNDFDNICYSWTMTLLQNDQIHLKMHSNGLYVHNGAYVWFNGQLLMKQ